MLGDVLSVIYAIAFMLIIRLLCKFKGDIKVNSGYNEYRFLDSYTDIIGKPFTEKDLEKVCKTIV